MLELNTQKIKEQILLAFPHGEPSLRKLCDELNSLYRLPGLTFWCLVRDVAHEQALLVKNFTENYPTPEYVFPPAVKVAMDYLTRIFNYAEKMIAILKSAASAN